MTVFITHGNNGSALHLLWSVRFQSSLLVLGVRALLWMMMFIVEWGRAVYRFHNAPFVQYLKY
jgi:hypothetical protein